MAYHNSWVEISKSALIHNVKIFNKIIGPRVRLIAVVKSNAYGHGLIEVSKILDKEKAVDFLATVNLAEALFLRQNNIKKPILVLSFYDLDFQEIKKAIKQKISLVVYSLEQAKFINQIAQSLRIRAKIHFKVDTGTSRLGLSPQASFKCIKTLLQYKNLFLEGLFTHYASSEEMDQSFTLHQTSDFYHLIRRLEKENIVIPVKHAACSAAALMNQQYHFDAIRLGISLYGLWSLEDGHSIRKKYYLKPALSWKTKVIQVKELNKGMTVGYGRTYQARQKVKIAALPVGYWDGYDRKLSNRGEVLINGQRCKILGRVCMNLIMVDVSGISVKVGDEAILIGQQAPRRGSGQGREEITVDELARKVGTINYEVVTRINPLLLRKIIY